MGISQGVAYSLSFAFYLSATFFQPFEVFGVDDVAKALLSLSKAGCCICLVVYAYKHRLNLWVMVVAAAVGAGGALLLAALSNIFFPMIYIANCFIGASSALLLMTIASLVTLLPNSSLRTYITLGYLLSILVSPLFHYFKALEDFSITAICYGLALLFTAFSLKLRGPQEVILGSVIDSSGKYRTKKKGRVLLEVVLSGKTFIPIVGAWLLSFSYGVFESGAFLKDIDLRLAEQILAFAFLVILLFFVLDGALKQKNSAKASNLFLLMCVLFLASFAAIIVFSGLTPLAFSLMSASLTFCYLVLWFTMCEVAQEQQLPAPFLFGLFVTAPVACVRMAGKLMPSLFYIITGSPMETWQAVLAVLALFIVVFIVIVFYLVRLESDSEKHFSTKGSEEEGTDENDPVSLFCREYGIAQREGEVLRRYAAGRSATHIAGELRLSEYTVKTYVRRIYTKLDIHNRQELIDLLESDRQCDEAVSEA